MVWRLPHAVDILEDAQVALAGNIAAQRADRRTVRDGNESIAEGVERIRNDPRLMVGEWRVPAKLDTIDLVAKALGGAEHRVVAAEKDIDRAFIGRHALEARDRQVEARPLLLRLAQVAEETGRKLWRFSLDAVQRGIVEDRKSV